MVFEGSVQAFDQLLQGAPLCGFGVQVLEANDLFMVDRRVIVVQSIQVVDAGRISGITVAYEDDFQVGRCSSDSFFHGDHSRQSATVVSDVIGGDFEAQRRDEEEHVVVLAQDLDVGFITGGDVVNAAFAMEIEAVAVESSSGGIVQHGLIRNPDIEDVAQNGGGFSGRDGERYIKGQDQTEDIL